MDARDRRIAELERIVAERDQQIAERDARITALEAQVAKLTALVEELTRKLSSHSGNSNQPPSGDPPSNRQARRAKDAQKRKGDQKKKRGGQPDHKGTNRALVPIEQVDEFVHLFPEECENCWQTLEKIPDDNPRRYQSTEIPPVKPHVTEYQRHAVQCSHCDHKTRATYDGTIIPSQTFGPRLSAIVSLLTGGYHLSRRRAADICRDLLGLEISVGAISAIEERISTATKPAFEEARSHFQSANVKHTDGTTWYQSGVLLSLWTMATDMVSVFKIVANGRMDTLKMLLGEPSGILVSDRATALKFWSMEMRQICWAHLLRKFISFSERDGPAGALGRELLDYVGILFTYWYQYKDGEISRSQLRKKMAPVQCQIEAALARGAKLGIKGISGACEDILAHKDALFTFVVKDDVEPTNNHAERELRAFVLWRKRSFGTQSERGNLFAERIMTVVHTAKKQKVDVLQFLTDCCVADREGIAPPSLLAAA